LISLMFRRRIIWFPDAIIYTGMKLKLIKILSSRSVKVLIILMISLAVIWFGQIYGPGDNNAEAKVFERIISYTRSIPGYLFDDKNTSEPRKIIINGSTTFITLGKSKDDISKILDFYVKQFPPQPVKKIEAGILKKIGNKELKASATQINKLLDCVRSSQHFREERDDFGLLGILEFHDPDMMLGDEKVIKAFGKMAETGKLGTIGTGRMVIALKNPDTKDTRIINIWTDRDFNLNNFFPDANGDMAGKDIPDVPRYPGSRRIFSIEQENTLSMDSLVSYEGGGGVVGTILFYHSRMKGWKTDPTFEKVMEEQSMKNMMFYTRKGRECTIQILEDEYTGKTITTITNREMKNG